MRIKKNLVRLQSRGFLEFFFNSMILKCSKNRKMVEYMTNKDEELQSKIPITYVK